MVASHTVVSVMKSFAMHFFTLNFRPWFYCGKCLLAKLSNALKTRLGAST